MNRIMHAILWWLSQRVPEDVPGSTRWIWRHVIKALDADGTPYLTRVLFPRVFGWRLYLHYFHRPDRERELHNHPWDKAYSLLVTGSYDETRLDGQAYVQRRVRWWNRIDASTFHRVSALHGHVWTLFFTGERIREDWGFRDRVGKFTPWREFFARHQGGR